MLILTRETTQRDEVYAWYGRRSPSYKVELVPTIGASDLSWRGQSAECEDVRRYQPNIEKQRGKLCKPRRVGV